MWSHQATWHTNRDEPCCFPFRINFSLLDSTVGLCVVFHLNEILYITFYKALEHFTLTLTLSNPLPCNTVLVFTCIVKIPSVLILLRVWIGVALFCTHNTPLNWCFCFEGWTTYPSFGFLMIFTATWCSLSFWKKPGWDNAVDHTTVWQTLFSKFSSYFNWKSFQFVPLIAKSETC